MFLYLNVHYVSKYELILFVWMGNKIWSHDMYLYLTTNLQYLVLRPEEYVLHWTRSL